MADKGREEGKPGMQATRVLSRSDTQVGGRDNWQFDFVVYLFTENNIFMLLHSPSLLSLILWTEKIYSSISHPAGGHRRQT